MNTRSTGIIAATALAAMAVSGCGVSVGFADYRHTTTPADTHITDSVNAVQVDSDDGHVTVSAGSGDGVTVHRVVHYQDKVPHPGQRVSNGTLTFTRGCSRCNVDYDITVPASVRVSAHSDGGRVVVTGVASADTRSDSGSVTVRHIAGAVSARDDSGKITVQDVGGALNASTDAGSIRASELRSATVRTSTDSGSLHLDFATAPSNVRATSDSGSVNLTVPDGPYAIDARNDTGGKSIEGVQSDANAPRKLLLRSDSGHISVSSSAGD